jgi:hypothetical protein
VVLVGISIRFCAYSDLHMAITGDNVAKSFTLPAKIQVTRGRRSICTSRQNTGDAWKIAGAESGMVL